MKEMKGPKISGGSGLKLKTDANLSVLIRMGIKMAAGNQQKHLSRSFAAKA